MPLGRTEGARVAAGAIGVWENLFDVGVAVLFCRIRNSKVFDVLTWSDSEILGIAFRTYLYVIVDCTCLLFVVC